MMYGKTNSYSYYAHGICFELISYFDKVSGLGGHSPKLIGSIFQETRGEKNGFVFM
jgi:hypothetical protein